MYELMSNVPDALSNVVADELDHYLGYVGIDQRVVSTHCKLDKLEAQNRKRREEAQRQRVNQQELDRKLKQDRLNAIRANAKSRPSLSAAPLPEVPPMPVPGADEPPLSTTDPTAHLPLPQRPGTPGPIRSPVHDLPLNQVRDRTTG